MNHPILTRVRICIGLAATGAALAAAPWANASTTFDMYDADADGAVDIGAVDTTGDGLCDVNVLDTTGDGVGDTFLLDPNQDRLVDATAYDTTGDGAIDTVTTDLDNDGLVEDQLVDYDGDHVPETSVGAPNLVISPDGTITVVETDMSVGGISDAYVDSATGPFMDDVEQMLATSSGVATAGVDIAGSWLPGVSAGTIADSSSVAAGALVDPSPNTTLGVNDLTGSTGHIAPGNTTPQ